MNGPLERVVLKGVYQLEPCNRGNRLIRKDNQEEYKIPKVEREGSRFPLDPRRTRYYHLRVFHFFEGGYDEIKNYFEQLFGVRSGDMGNRTFRRHRLHFWPEGILQELQSFPLKE